MVYNAKHHECMPSQLLTTCLPPEVTEKLLPRQVRTLRDLIEFDGPSPVRSIPVTLASLKNYAISQSTAALCEIQDHSWLGAVCHVQTSTGGIVRGKIGHLAMFPHDIQMQVVYLRNPAKKRYVSMLEILFNHALWVMSEILSDSEDECSTDSCAYDDEVRPLLPLTVKQTPEIIRLGGVQGLRLQKTLATVNSMHTLLQPTVRQQTASKFDA